MFENQAIAPPDFETDLSGLLEMLNELLAMSRRQADTLDAPDYIALAGLAERKAAMLDSISITIEQLRESGVNLDDPQTWPPANFGVSIAECSGLLKRIFAIEKFNLRKALMLEQTTGEKLAEFLSKRSAITRYGSAAHSASLVNFKR